jgi:hypothetical protein
VNAAYAQCSSSRLESDLFVSQRDSTKTEAMEKNMLALLA